MSSLQQLPIFWFVLGLACGIVLTVVAIWFVSEPCLTNTLDDALARPPIPTPGTRAVPPVHPRAETLAIIARAQKAIEEVTQSDEYQNGAIKQKAISVATESPFTELLITQCSDPSMWYSKLVGERVPFCGRWVEGYKSRQREGYINLVHFHDATIVDKVKV